MARKPHQGFITGEHRKSFKRGAIFEPLLITAGSATAAGTFGFGAGAVGGAMIGLSVGGPVGAVIGAFLGAIVGGGAGAMAGGAVGAVLGFVKSGLATIGYIGKSVRNVLTGQAGLRDRGQSPSIGFEQRGEIEGNRDIVGGIVAAATSALSVGLGLWVNSVFNGQPINPLTAVKNAFNNARGNGNVLNAHPQFPPAGMNGPYYPPHPGSPAPGYGYSGPGYAPPPVPGPTYGAPYPGQPSYGTPYSGGYGSATPPAPIPTVYRSTNAHGSAPVSSPPASGVPGYDPSVAPVTAVPASGSARFVVPPVPLRTMPPTGAAYASSSTIAPVSSPPASGVPYTGNGYSAAPASSPPAPHSNGRHSVPPGGQSTLDARAAQQAVDAAIPAASGARVGGDSAPARTATSGQQRSTQNAGVPGN